MREVLQTELQQEQREKSSLLLIHFVFAINLYNFRSTIISYLFSIFPYKGIDLTSFCDTLESCC